MQKTKIGWTDYTWNPICGCSKGCSYCYARRLAKRFKQRCEWCYRFVPHLHPERLEQPPKVKKPSKIFVGSMAELFDPKLPPDEIRTVLEAASRANWHTYMFLTKQPDQAAVFGSCFEKNKNFQLGVSCENQEAVDRLVSELSLIPAAKRFVSFEPLQDDVYIGFYLEYKYLDWVIVGAQSGPKAVPPKPEWVQSIIDQCRAAKVPLFLKSNLNWPEKIQEWPG